MNAVMYGAGNIGRGFIGALFSGAGYRVAFIDIADTVIEALNRAHEYPLCFVSNHGKQENIVRNVYAIHGSECKAVSQCIAQADVMAVSVGVRALPYIIPNLVAGIRARFSSNQKPLDILICENLMDAHHYLSELIQSELTVEEQVLFDQKIGLVEVSIGRMVPVQTPAMQAGNPLRICTERYGFLPVDQAAFKGDIPAIEALIPARPFDYYIKRKLYIHNMGHAICAYLGLLIGKNYIYQAIAEPGIRIIVQNAMLESAEALSLRYHHPISPLLRHIDDLLNRFSNQELGDTVLRVGQDPKRKLSWNDRFIGAARECIAQGIDPCFIAAGAAGGLYYLLGSTQYTCEDALALLCEVSDLHREDRLTYLIMESFDNYISKKNTVSILNTAYQIKLAFYGDIV